MEKSKFNEIVNQLLEPTLKPTVLKNRRAQGKEHTDVQDRSIILSPRPVIKACGDCGELVANRQVEYAVYAIGTPKRHWKKKCMECGKNTAFPPGTGFPK
jgi:hypothetical protein